MTPIQEHAFEFGRAFERLTECYNFKDIVAFINGDDNPSGEIAFYKLKPLFDLYGYNEVISKIKQEAKKELEVVDENLEPVNESKIPEVTESHAYMFWESKENYKGANENE